jgi:hypothetical protein
MGLAKLVAEFLSANLRHSNGEPVECVIADTCIGGVAEAAQTAQKFSRAGVGVSITVTPCWCYGSETMDMDPFIPKAVWGFNGTERPGAVYLAAVLAAHNQKGIPAFSIYGHDVKDAGDRNIPDDVQENYCVLPGLVWRWLACAVSLICRLAAHPWGLPPDCGSVIFENYLGMRGRSRRHDGNYAPHRRRDLRS